MVTYPIHYSLAKRKIQKINYYFVRCLGVWGGVLSAPQVLTPL